MRISRLDFLHYKAFERFTLEVDRVNVLTGANNAGKSTVVGALRALAIAIRSARIRAPERIFVGGVRHVGWRISQKVLPISLENVQTNYEEGDSRVLFTLLNGARLTLHFDPQEGCVLVPEDFGVTTAAAFKKHYPLDLVAVPVLGAVEQKEPLLEEDTVNAALATPRASRHFRNFWYRRREQFEPFASLVASTWPGMVIKSPELDPLTRELTMFVSEDRIDRELHWVGYGFQIWCQLLAHLMRADSGSLVIVDEPETYLHPDIQRKLLHVLKQTGADIVLATHSPEILAEADPAEIVLVDKRRHAAQRLKDVKGVRRALDVLGSQKNLALASLARNRKVLFLEREHDFVTLRRLARRVGLGELAAGNGIAVMTSGGLDAWQRVAGLAEGAGQATGAELAVACVFDRGGREQAEIDSVLTRLRGVVRVAHVHDRHDLGSYLLVPAAWDRILQAELTRAGDPKAASAPGMTEPLLDQVVAELAAIRLKAAESDVGLWLQSASADVPDSQSLRERLTGRNAALREFPATEVLQRLRALVESRTGVHVSDTAIVEALAQEDIPSDLRHLLSALETFRTGF